MKKKQIEVSKDEVIKDLQKVQNKYIKEKKEGIITRNYYRKYGNYPTPKIEDLFDSFTQARNEAQIEEIPEKEKITRYSFNITKINKKKNKRFFISSIIPSAPINEKFWDSIQTYCNYNKAEPLLLVMRGVKADDEFTEDVLEKYQKYFCTEVIFNSNLVAKDFLLNPQQILPLTGLQRYGSKQHSLLVSHSKSMFSTIPKQPNEFPHIILSTGTICEPIYRNTRQGQIAKEDNCLSGWIVEVKDETIYFLRAIRFDGNGFQDLNKYYNSKQVVVKNVNSVVFEPHFGIEDELGLKQLDEIIVQCKPKNIFIHDSFDGGSINPHDEEKIGIKCNLQKNQQTLEVELNHLGNQLQILENKYKNITYYHVSSNHNNFVKKYLEEGKFINDYNNVKIGAELFLAQVNGNDPIEYFLKHNFKLKKQKFLKTGESFILNGCEMNTHGHKGSNGSRGNLKNIEMAYNNAFIGHSHSPAIWRDVFCVPCLCQLQQTYNKDGASSWLQGCGLLFDNGRKQLILNIFGEWKL